MERAQAKPPCILNPCLPLPGLRTEPASEYVGGVREAFAQKCSNATTGIVELSDTNLSQNGYG